MEVFLCIYFNVTKVNSMQTTNNNALLRVGIGTSPGPSGLHWLHSALVLQMLERTGQRDGH